MKKMFTLLKLLIILLPCFAFSQPKIELGVDVFFKDGYVELLKNKKVGLITNHTGVDRHLRSSIDLFKQHALSKEFSLIALFAPEHGINGKAYAGEKCDDVKTKGSIPIYSLHGSSKRPTDEMLKEIDVLIYDIQDIGSRSYTYATTLFYVMEEAAKKKIQVIVLDRPNPLNGIIVDGPMLNSKWRSFFGYVNVPYCHGMTVGELAQFFNTEYQVGCNLKIIPMRGWERSMNFKETGLAWIPTSPHIPESDTPLFYASTGILGELDIVNIGVGYTTPFKVIGAPWIDSTFLSEKLNAQRLPGVKFVPFNYRPFYGSYKGQDCQGSMIVVTDQSIYRPLAVQYLIIGILKSLYPKEVEKKLASVTTAQKALFCKVNGNEEMFSLLLKEKFVAWKLIQFNESERKEFLSIRQKYLLY
ncbi:MAG TPA: DUF1343 domain-containing protein [Rhabdochlamydiaceae bacterium]|nr:DUF1343 domain-containing protein [Rhabdochlamydiaceae bacterium]